MWLILFLFFCINTCVLEILIKFFETDSLFFKFNLKVLYCIVWSVNFKRKLISFFFRILLNFYTIIIVIFKDGRGLEICRENEYAYGQGILAELFYCDRSV